MTPVMAGIVPPAVEDLVRIFEEARVPTEIDLGTIKGDVRTVFGSSE